MQKSKKEHKQEIKKFKEDHTAVVKKLQEQIEDLQDLESNYKDQIDAVHKAMNHLGEDTNKKLNEKNDAIKRLEEQVHYQQSKIAKLYC